jgi:peroxiredoxin
VDSIFKIGDRAPDVTVLNTEGQSVALSESWRDGPILLTFLRHFG